MESLHISFQRVVDVGMFTGIKLSSSLNISHLFYADDAIFLGQWNDSNIDTLVHVMECFYRVSGLRINLCKSKIMGIHVDADRIKSAASKLGCLVLNTPFLYLGTKVGENMSRVHAWKEVIVKIKSRLSNWKLKTLSIGGRFTLLKSVLGSTPIFHMSIYKVPSSVLHLLESIRSHFFHGHDPRSKKASWVNWNKVLTAKERGGLGVSSLYALNRGLMCKWVWRFFAHKSLLWSRVIKAIHGPEGGLITDVRRGFRSTWTSIVQEVKKLQNQGVNIFDYIRIKIGNGDNTSFWKDKWHNEGVLKDVFPRLYALERHQNVTIHTKLIDYSLVNSFRRNPRSGVEEFQLDNLSRLVSTITLSSAVDRYVWSLENSGEFSVKSIRQVIDANCFPVIHSATRWVKSVPLKVNIMAWKIKMDGLPTRMNISRRGIEIDSIVCPICNSGAESSCHIFFQCNLVRQLARKISSWWNVDYVDVSSYEEWYTWLVSLRLQANLKAVFEGIFYCLWWSVWMFRNKILFENDTPSQARIFDNIVQGNSKMSEIPRTGGSILSVMEEIVKVGITIGYNMDGDKRYYGIIFSSIEPMRSGEVVMMGDFNEVRYKSGQDGFDKFVIDSLEICSWGLFKCYAATCVVRWDFLDDILVKFGFGIKWRGWIQNCLNSSKGSILVNGSPTEEFQFYKGLKQVPFEVSPLQNPFRVIFFPCTIQEVKKHHGEWNKVLTAKERGGLGVSSLYALNRGLMCKWVWRFFAHKSLLWSRVIKAIHGPEGGLNHLECEKGYFRSTWTSIVQEVKKLQNQGVNIFDYIRIKIGNRDNTSFWKDKWHNEGVLKDVFPRLYALERHQNVNIHTKLIDYSLVNSFRRNPRSGVEEFQLDNLSREFSVKSIWQVIDANCFPVIHSATRWVKSVPLKVTTMA
ncbi:RNA-directed DNA polymerase, eukaryota, reverse transcriptase zinc-binding domain protein [Tanacetum coccineum]